MELFAVMKVHYTHTLDGNYDIEFHEKFTNLGVRMTTDLLPLIVFEAPSQWFRFLPACYHFAMSRRL